MTRVNISHLTPENVRALELRRKFNDELRLKPEIFWPFWRPCNVNLLIVVDGLDFSDQDFGLATFVRTLLDTPGSYVRFRITLAHIGAASGTQMLDSEPRIVRRITQFKFDDANHFTPDMYHEVMLFGIATSFPGRGTASNGQPYPANQLAEPELRALTEFMNGGGGLFGTGDHGSLGRFLCGEVPRIRNMRLWSSTSAQNALDEVSMNGPRRNDTNRPGASPGSQFDDQSDDTPQDIQPKIYTKQNGLFRYRFPHPLLCGPNGVIRVMPDHPHEGECVEPANTGLTLNFGGALGPEYPNAVGPGGKPLPEIVSRSTVFSGTTSGGKAPTVSQSFGGICAYDGHRAGIGRVVTDATWHHFVNINLVGDIGLSPMDPKSMGFLATPAGQAHLENIKAYYRNIAVWLSPRERIQCMNARLCWHLVWTSRVMEAVLSTTDLKLTRVEPHIFWIIGKHARDVLGNFAGQCQSVRLILDLVFERASPDLIPEIDPWITAKEDEVRGAEVIDWFDGNPLLDMGFGAALVALREKFPQPSEKTTEDLDVDRVTEILSSGAKVGVERAFKSMEEATASIRRLIR